MLRHVVSLIIVAALCLVFTSEAAAQRRRGGRGGGGAAAARQRLIAAAQAQLQASEALLTAATVKGGQADGEIRAALDKLSQAKHEMEAAEDEVKQLARHLREIEQGIIADQKADSAFAKAKAAADESRLELAMLESRLLTEGNYDERKAAAANGAEVVQLRNKLLNDNLEYRLAKEKAAAAAKELNRIREDLFHQDQEWKEISSSLAEAHREDDHAHDKANSAGVSRLAPLKDSRDASQVAAFARMNIANAQATLAQLGVKQQTNKSNAPSKAPGKK